MAKNMLLILGLVFLVGCSSNPNKAEKIDTTLVDQQELSSEQSIGLNKKEEIVFQQKIKLVEYLKNLQYEVYQLETDIYGNEDHGGIGLYGVLRNCQDRVRSTEYGGDGKVTPPIKKEILTKDEDVLVSNLLDKVQNGKIGIDEKEKIVALKEELLTERIKRFESYRESYRERKDWIEEETRKCKAQEKSLQDRN